ncbi:hypothetical protein ACIBG0_33290 [Nocardia sp. NPDC050630]|uniref:hypothetical protein n=1 Tax=Nocardia sp. NPDC050630 TaxID=3364321 RepID=UPI00378EDC9F
MINPQTHIETPKVDDSKTAEAQYADALELLANHGYVAGIADTGGGCEAIEIIIDDDHRVLATDKDELLAWERADHQGWRAGLYLEDDLEKSVTTDDCSAEGLLSLVKPLLADRSKVALAS